MSPGLAYLVVRCHSMMADLLSPEEMRSFAEARDLEELLSRLAQTPYGDALREVERSATAIERAYSRVFTERVRKVVDVAPERSASFLKNYYYMRFEVINLKRIMRGIYADLLRDRILESLIPMPPYRGPDFEELSKAESIEDVVESFRGTPYEPGAYALELYEKYGVLWPLEQALGRVYVEEVSASIEGLRGEERPVAHRVVGLVVDVENILLALKRRGDLKLGRLPPLEALFPATYRLGLDILRSILEAREAREAVALLPSPHKGIVEPILYEDVAGVRTNLHRHLYRVVGMERMKNDFGFNIVFAYLVFSEMEKEDLVRITWSIMQGLKLEDILKYLVVAFPAA